MVAVAAQYRLSDQKEVTPHEAMADARAVIRWVRAQAYSLGVDPNRVVAYGWSAGKGLPPTLILQGDVDTVTPMAGAKRFCERMRAAGNVCELHV